MYTLHVTCIHRILPVDIATYTEAGSTHVFSVH